VCSNRRPNAWTARLTASTGCGSRRRLPFMTTSAACDEAHETYDLLTPGSVSLRASSRAGDRSSYAERLAPIVPCLHQRLTKWPGGVDAGRPGGAGFEGFQRLVELRQAGVPKRGGVYVVLRPSPDQPRNLMSWGAARLESRFQPWLLPGANLRGGFDLANFSPSASSISRMRPFGHGRFLWTEIPKGQSDPLKGRSTRGRAPDPTICPWQA
jgi:hypothetical protein